MAIVINGTGTIAGVSATGITTAPTNATDTTKLPLAGGTMTGTLVAPAITVGNSSIGSNASHLASLTINNNQYIGSANATNAIQIPTGGGINVTGAVNSTGEMRVTNPSATSQLYLYGAAGQKANIILNEYGVRAWHVGAGTYTSGQFSISDGSTERMRIASNGNVGIGISPANTLDIYEATGPDFRMSSGQGGATTNHSIKANGSAALYSRVGGSSVGGTTWAGLSGSNQVSIEAQSASSFTLGTWGDFPTIFVASRAEKMRLQHNGNFGIGTTDPQATLHVNGSINIGNHATMMSKATTGVTNPSISFNVKHANDAGWYNHAIAYNCVYSWNYSGSDSVRTGVIHIKKYATTLAMANDYTDQTVGSTINVSVSNVDRYNFTVTFSVTASAPRSMAATITHTGMSAAWGIT